MSDLSSLLVTLGQEAESKIKSEISGPLNVARRFLYDAMMPLHLNITGESDEYSLEFIAGGNVELHHGPALHPDISLKGDASTISSVLIKRSSHLFNEAEQEGKVTVTTHTWKGEQALQKVRELLSAAP